MRAGMPGLPVYGYHHHAAGTATINIRLLGFFTVLHQEGDTMNKAETATLFNDMCLPAPATLIDQRIHRAMLHDSTVRGTFTNGNIIVSAVLYFGEDGKPVNYISGDHTDVADMCQDP